MSETPENIDALMSKLQRLSLKVGLREMFEPAFQELYETMCCRHIDQETDLCKILIPKNKNTWKRLLRLCREKSGVFLRKIDEEIDRIVETRPDKEQMNPPSGSVHNILIQEVHSIQKQNLSPEMFTESLHVLTLLLTIVQSALNEMQVKNQSK